VNKVKINKTNARAVVADVMARLAQISLIATTAWSASHAAASEPLNGAWGGTIGSDSVRVCFRDGDASFYRSKHRVGIGFSVGQDPSANSTWQVSEMYSYQAESTGYWTLSLVNATTLQGVRTDATDGRYLQPIQLRKIPRTAPYERFVFSCESAYYDPLVQATKVSIEDRIFENHAYTEIRSKYGRTFQLPDTHPQASRINAFNKRWLNLQLAGSHGCDLSASHAVKWFNSQKPVVWTDQWLVAKAVQDHTYCGGAHGDSYTEVTVFDLDLGKPIDTWRWIKGGQASANPSGGAVLRTAQVIAATRGEAEAIQNF
jgi:hypothetical protein